MNPNDTDGHQVGNGLGAEQPNTFAPNTGAIPNTVTSEAFSALQQNTFTPNTGDAFNAPQAPIISSSPDPEDKKENSITRAFGGRSRASKIAAQAPVQPSRLRQNAPDFFQQSMQQQDIVLNNEAEQKAKGKKGLIIGVIIGGVALLACAILLIVTFVPHKAVIGKKDEEAITAWNALANFMLSSTESLETPIIENDKTYNLRVITRYNTSPEQYEKLTELKDDFLNKKEDTIFSSDEKLVEYVDALNKYFSILRYELETKEYSTMSEIADLYASSDYSNAKNTIEDYYLSLENQEAFGYIYQNEQAMSLAYLDAVDFYVKNGCTHGEDRVINCSDYIKSTGEYVDMRKKLTIAGGDILEVQKTIDNATVEIITNITGQIQELQK